MKVVKHANANFLSIGLGKVKVLIVLTTEDEGLGFDVKSAKRK